MAGMNWTDIEDLAVSATENAALACFEWIGRDDKIAADAAAVAAMRKTLSESEYNICIAIGEGELDEAPMLSFGDVLGLPSGPTLAMAVDPLEGTTLCAQGKYGSSSTIAFAQANHMLVAPDSYMMKVMAGPSCPDSLIDVDIAVDELAVEYARSTGKPVGDVVVCILDKPRHQQAIADAKRAGARVHAIDDADVPAALWVCDPEQFGVDLYWGIGGGPEGILSASALQCLGGKMAACFAPKGSSQLARLEEVIGASWTTHYRLDDLVTGPAVFAMSSITGTPGLSPLLQDGTTKIVETFCLGPTIGGMKKIVREFPLS